MFQMNLIDDSVERDNCKSELDEARKHIGAAQLAIYYVLRALVYAVLYIGDILKNGQNK